MTNRTKINYSPHKNSVNHFNNHTLKNSQNSYLRQHWVKKNADSMDYEITDHAAYFYQGCFIKNEKQYIKNGEGILLTKKGSLAIGNWNNNNLQGRCIILTPFGGAINANFVQGKLQGWCIASYLNRIIVCTLYYNDKIDGEKLIYEYKEKLWIASKYNKQGQLQRIINVEKEGIPSILPSFIDQPDLSYLLSCFHKNMGYDLLKTNQIKFMNVTKNISYIGYLDQNQQPKGLGFLYDALDHYAGNFKNGILQIYGRILFENGSIYHGQLLNGQFNGVGFYYDSQSNSSSIVKSENNQIMKKQNSISGYVCIEIQTSFGKKIKSKFQQEALRSTGLIQLCSFLERYYTHFINQSLDLNQKQISVKTLCPCSNHAKDLQNHKWLQNKWINQKQGSGQSQCQSHKQDNFFVLKQVQTITIPENRSSNSQTFRNIEDKVYSLPKQMTQRKYQMNNFQSIAIQQLQNAQQSQGFQKNLPKNQSITDKNVSNDKIKSLDFGQITFRRRQSRQNMFQIKAFRTPVLNPKAKKLSTNLSYMQDSQISNLSKKVDDLIIPSNTIRKKSTRKRIFQ